MIPHDIKTAFATLLHLRAQVSEHREIGGQVVVAMSALLLGAVSAWVILPSSEAVFWGQSNSQLLAVAAGLLTYAAILIGFVVNLMLFSGKIGQSDDQKLEELKSIVDRVRYLLYSQLVTMFSAIGLSVMSLITVLSLAVDVGGVSSKILVSVSSGFAILCILRTAILPLQIYELHEASFVSTLMRKRKITKEMHQRRGHD